jgi:hypothetical protein
MIANGLRAFARVVTAFRDRTLGAPDVIPGEVYMLPAERGEVSE